MKNDKGRRQFIRNTAITGIGLGMSNFLSLPSFGKISISSGKKVGIIGLDTSHSIAFTKLLNKEDAAVEFAGYKVVAAYPYGSRDIKSSAERIPGYTEEVKKMGVQIVGSIDELLTIVDVVLLETNDGRLHLEQVLPVFKAGKSVFIDKPVAASLADAMSIFDAAKKYKVPVFTTSSLRYAKSTQETIHEQKFGKILGADFYSPLNFEKTHPDLFWYGIHGVEPLFALMGMGCDYVVRSHTDVTDIVVATWKDKRIGTYRGIVSGKQDYGGTVFGEKGIAAIGTYSGNDPLLVKIIEFFETGIPPVSAEETLEIFAFMEAADESKRRKGAPVTLAEMYKKASSKKHSNKI